MGSTVTINDDRVSLCIVNYCTQMIRLCKQMQEDPLNEYDVPGFKKSQMGIHVDLEPIIDDFRSIRDQLSNGT